MYQEVIGVESVDYVSRKTGLPVSGQRIHLADHRSRPNVQGVTVESVYIPSALLARLTCVPQLGDNVFIVYDRSGKVADVFPGAVG